MCYSSTNLNGTLVTPTDIRDYVMQTHLEETFFHCEHSFATSSTFKCWSKNHNSV